MNVPLTLRALCCAWITLLCSVASGPSVALQSELARDPLVAPAPAATTAAVPLAALGNLVGPLRIKGESSTGTLTIPVSAREVVRAAMLHLVASNSVSLLSERSQLVVRVNDRTVAQFSLSSRQPELSADIRLPADLLRPGYNTLTFTVAQHSTENCEDPDSPELWTEIDTNASTLQMQTDLVSVNPTLADLSDLIDPKQSFGRNMTIVSASHPHDDLALATDALLAEGVALRLRYAPAVLYVEDAQRGVGSGLLPGLASAGLTGSDVLLVGTREALQPYVDERVLGQIGGAFLGIYPKPDDPRHFVLIVGGRDEHEVALAARTFAHAELPLPRRADITIDALTEARVSAAATHLALSDSRARRLSELGFKSRTLGETDHADIEVVLPADIYGPEDAQVALDLNFTEGARMRQDSVLNIYLNNRFEQVVALDQQEGAVLRHYRVNIPLRSFRAGNNVLSFRPVLVPLVSDRCALRETRNLQLSLFDDSWIRLPSTSHFTTLPDLKRLAESGFPYVSGRDGGDFALRLTANDNDTLAAAWRLLGKLAQKQGSPLSAAQVTLGETEPGRNTILLGAAAELPVASIAGAPWQPGSVLRVASHDDANEPGDVTAHGLWDKLRDFSTLTAHPAAVSPQLAVRGTLPLSQQLLIMQYRSATGTTTTVLTAASASELARGIEQLVDPGRWEQLTGDVGVLSLDAVDLWTGQIGDRYEVGQISTFERLGFEVSAHPWLGYAALVFLLGGLAALTSLMLRRYHRRHHESTKD
jgi:hypothetical protein